jgi:hypothetical protein
MADWFVKTVWRDYIAFMPKPNIRTTLLNPAAAFNNITMKVSQTEYRATIP